MPIFLGATIAATFNAGDVLPDMLPMHGSKLVESALGYARSHTPAAMVLDESGREAQIALANEKDAVVGMEWQERRR